MNSLVASGVVDLILYKNNNKIVKEAISESSTSNMSCQNGIGFAFDKNKAGTSDMIYQKKICHCEYPDEPISTIFWGYLLIYECKFCHCTTTKLSFKSKK